MDLRVSLGKRCWDCLNHFPQVREFLIFEWEVDLKLQLEPLCLRNQLLAKSFTIEILYFDFWFLIFWDLFCTALSSNIVFWQTKTPNWVVLIWGECFVVLDRGTRLRCRTEVQDWNLRDVVPSKLPSVTSLQVSTSWCGSILCK